MMQYRRFGKTGISVSALGFGILRLPLLSGAQGVVGSVVDEKETIAMMHYAIDHGLNYIDTAYNYYDGESERIIGRALQGAYREKVYTATKSPVWLLKKEEDFDLLLDEQLARLQDDHIDIYLLHGLNKVLWEKKVLRYNAIERLAAAKAAGKVRYVGFSFHDDLDTFKEIIDYYPDWDLCQIQLNYLDKGYQAGILGLKYAAERDLAVVIMEPMRGGYLAEVPAEVHNIFRSGGAGKHPVEWALDFLWDMPEVSIVLSGMSTMQQVKDDLEYADRSSAGMLSVREKLALWEAKEKFRSYSSIPCTGCAYCAHCPKGVVISYIFNVYNEYCASGDLARARKKYRESVPMFGAPASACIACGKCEEACPQHIKIIEWLSEVNRLLG